MQVRKCDRCGEIFEGDRKYAQIVCATDNGFEGAKNHWYDLCQGCSSELGLWFKQKRSMDAFEF